MKNHQQLKESFFGKSNHSYRAEIEALKRKILEEWSNPKKA